jgi:hypothetical protein
MFKIRKEEHKIKIKQNKLFNIHFVYIYIFRIKCLGKKWIKNCRYNKRKTN